jgi:hypothetical protein
MCPRPGSALEIAAQDRCALLRRDFLELYLFPVPVAQLRLTLRGPHVADPFGALAEH